MPSWPTRTGDERGQHIPEGCAGVERVYFMTRGWRVLCVCAGAVASVVLPGLAAGSNQNAAATTTVTFGVGSATWTVPDGVSEITVDVYGAAGGANFDASGRPGQNAGGMGAHAHGTIAVTTGEQFTIEGGQAGPLVVSGQAEGWTPGGFGPIGGLGYNGHGNEHYAGNGGGASAIVAGPTTLIVAGAGGGAGAADPSDPSWFALGGRGGDSGKDGGNGQDEFNTTYSCTAHGGTGGQAGRANGGGLHGTGGHNDCLNVGLGDYNGNDGQDGDTYIGASAIGHGGEGGMYGGGGGGGGWHGGGGGGSGAVVSDYNEPGHEPSVGGEGGGGGGSSHIDPSVSNGSVVDGVRSGDGEVDISYVAPGHALTVQRTGSGSGTVTSSPAGIDCGTSCSASFHDGAVVTLAAGAHSGSTFVGWSGSDCARTGACQVTMSSDEAVIARFVHKPDAQIRLGSDSAYIGAGVYNTSASGQTRTGRASHGHTETFDIAIRNAGTATASFTLKGWGGGSGSNVTYLAGLTGSRNISSAMEAGKYTLSNMPASSTRFIRLLITVERSASSGTSFSRAVTATSAAASTASDTVKAVVHVKSG
jgi:hypothetical protein